MDRRAILDASPSQLFADALESRRALRKAYADLIRQYGPERDPECFRHIRDAYEVLSSHFDAPRPAASSPHGDTHDRVAPGTPPVAAVLGQCVGLLEAERPLDALRLLDEHEALLRKREPKVWFELMLRSLLEAGYDVSAERISRAFDDLDDPQFELNEDTYFAVASRWTSVQAWSTARDDEQLPTVFRQALIARHTASRLELAQRWRDVLSKLGEDGLTTAYRRVAFVHSGLLPVLHEIDDAISGVSEATRKWEFGSPPVNVPAQHAAEISTLSKLYKRQLEPARKANLRLVMLMGSLCVLIPILPLPKDFRALAPWIVIFGGLGGFGFLLLWKRLNDPVHLLRRADWLEARVRKLIDESGMFRHEALAAIVGRRLTPHVKVGQGFFAVAKLDPLTALAEQPPLELGFLSAAHLARIEREQSKT